MSAPVVLVLRFLLALTLYAFLGWALLAVWRDLRTQATLLATRKIPGIDLIVQIKDQEPIRHFFNQPEILIGRDPHCDVPILDDTISVRHARLSYHHGQWWLDDLSSTNGTRLNNEELTLPTVIINDDQVECGQANITIKLGIDPATPPTLRMRKSGDNNEP